MNRRNMLRSLLALGAAVRAKVYEHLLGTSTSTMSKGIYGAAARESAQKAGLGQ